MVEHYQNFWNFAISTPCISGDYSVATTKDWTARASRALLSAPGKPGPWWYRRMHFAWRRTENHHEPTKDPARLPSHLAIFRAGHLSRPVAKALGKLDQLEALLLAEAGASIAEVMAGALKKRGLVISSDRIEGVRRYRGVRP